MVQCFLCIDSCKKHTLKVNRWNCYKRDIEKNRFVVDKECSLCNRCIYICPIRSTINGDIEEIAIETQINKSVQDCNFCILCAGKPDCIELSNDENMPGLLFSIFDYLKFKLRGSNG